MFFAGQVSGLLENFNIKIYPDTINVINVNLCMMLVLIELYVLMPLSMTLTIFQGHSNIEQFKLKSVCSDPVKLKLYRIVK